MTEQKQKIPKVKNIVPKKIHKQIKVKTGQLDWSIDPIQKYTMKMKLMKIPAFREAMGKNLSGLYYQFLRYKVEKKENVVLECKGLTRSGKTVAMIGTKKYIASESGVPFLIEQVCPNEQYYLDAVKTAIFHQGFVVDEQLETHVGIGSYREMQMIEDLNNIIAKLCLHTSWIHPPDFVGRNSFYGLETIGRDFNYKLTRLLLYDLTQKTFGASSIPLGYVIIPKYDDPEFEKIYEAKKDKHIDELRGENIAVRQQRRLDEGFALARNSLFAKCTNSQQRLQVSRNLFPMRTEGEYMELISIAKMNNKLGVNQRDFDNAKAEVDKELKEIKAERKG